MHLRRDEPAAAMCLRRDICPRGKLFPIKRREFDGFLGFFAGSENPSVRVAHFTFEIALSGTIMLTLLLVCSFSPKVRKYLLGSPDCFVFEIALSGTIMLTLLLVCSFSPKVRKYLLGSPDCFVFEIALSGTIMLTLLLVCSFSPRKYKSILRGFYNKDSLPGDSHVARHKLHF